MPKAERDHTTPAAVRRSRSAGRPTADALPEPGAQIRLSADEIQILKWLRDTSARRGWHEAMAALRAFVDAETGRAA